MALKHSAWKIVRWIQCNVATT